MTTPDQDRYWMQRALELARRGIAVSSPNPAVGCVILDRAGQVAGEGWHEYDLVDHAEVVALKVAEEHAGNRLLGRTAPAAGQHTLHEPYWITCEAARAAVQPLRWQADAALTGVDTVLADDPLLTDRSGLRRRRPLLRVVLDSALRMPLDAKMVATAQNDVVIFTVSKDEGRIHELESRGVRVEVLAAEAGRVPLSNVLDKLGEEGILTLLTETGTRLNTALLAASLVDRVHLFVSPQIMGSDAVPAFRGMAHAIRMADVEVERYDNDLGLCSLLKDPWPVEAGTRD